MKKIYNWDMKITFILIVATILMVFIPCITVLFIYKQWAFGILSIIMLLLIIIAVSIGSWYETIVIDKEKIVVYRHRKEINRINWQDVKEIYKKEIIARYRLYCYYYFSDGQDRFLNDKDGNEHFVVFRCPRNKENIFSKFTDLPIQQKESKNN